MVYQTLQDSKDQNMGSFVHIDPPVLSPSLSFLWSRWKANRLNTAWLLMPISPAIAWLVLFAPGIWSNRPSPSSALSHSQGFRPWESSGSGWAKRNRPVHCHDVLRQSQETPAWTWCWEEHSCLYLFAHQAVSLWAKKHESRKYFWETRSPV